jgi:hypothetical protein
MPRFALRPATIAGVAFAAAMLAGGCAEIPPRPLPPTVALAGLRVTRFLPQDTRVTLDLVVGNPNSYDLDVSTLDATVSVDGETLLTGALLAPVTLAASKDSRVAIEARMTLAPVMAALDRFARQPIVRYEVSGSAVVQNGWTLPYRRRGELPGAAMFAPRS